MTPPLPLNENVPLPSANRLRGGGWDVLAIAESHASIDNTGVLRLARDTSRWLITEFLRVRSRQITCAECPIIRLLRQLPTTDFRDTLHVSPDPKLA
jgi:hypothetical protein